MGTASLVPPGCFCVLKEVSEASLFTFCCLFSLQDPDGEDPLGPMAVVRTLQTVCSETEQMARRTPIADEVSPHHNIEVFRGPLFMLFKTPVKKPHPLERSPFKPPEAASQNESWSTCLKPLTTTGNVDELLQGAETSFVPSDALSLELPMTWRDGAGWSLGFTPHPLEGEKATSAHPEKHLLSLLPQKT